MWGFPCGTVVKNPPANAEDIRDLGSIPGSGRSSGVRNGNPLQYSYMENSMGTETQRATVNGVTKSLASCFIHSEQSTDSPSRETDKLLYYPELCYIWTHQGEYLDEQHPVRCHQNE